MTFPLQQRTRGEQGFTLIEVLVVILIIGILAAIAIPVFLSQRSKAYDALAKETARSGLQAAETYSTDHEGLYTNISLEALHQYESAIQIAPGHNNAYLSVAEEREGGKGYIVTAVAPGPGGDTFSITRKQNGEVLRSCKAGNSGEGGCKTGSW